MRRHEKGLLTARLVRMLGSSGTLYGRPTVHWHAAMRDARLQFLAACGIPDGRGRFINCLTGLFGRAII